MGVFSYPEKGSQMEGVPRGVGGGVLMHAPPLT